MQAFRYVWLTDADYHILKTKSNKVEGDEEEQVLTIKGMLLAFKDQETAG